MITPLVFGLILASPPPDPCGPASTHLGAATTWADVTAAAFDWPDRRLDWDDLRARFPITERRALLRGASTRIELVRGDDQVALITARQVDAGAWCVAGTFTLYFGGRGLTLRTAEAQPLGADQIVLLDLEGRYSSPDDAFERMIHLLRVGPDMRLLADETPTLSVGSGEQLNLSESAGGRLRLLVQRAPPTDVYALDAKLAPRRLYGLPGIGGAAQARRKSLERVCAEVRAVRPPPVSRAALERAPHVFVGTLTRVGGLAHPTESTDGAVLPASFGDITNERAPTGQPAAPEARTVVVPAAAALAADLVALGAADKDPPAACLGKLGLPARLVVGRRYRVYAAAVVEGEQRALTLEAIAPRAR